MIIFLSDGVPNVWQSSSTDVNDHITAHPNSDYYGSDYIWYNAALMQVAQFKSEDDGYLYPVGMGLGADLDFMDRVARVAGTDQGGLSPRGTGNPADYEQRLIDILNKIVKNPGTRLVN